jgi:hypothetical protein
MSRPEKTGEDLQPAEAFVFAFDHAIAVTVKCLREKGCDEECIWQALKESLATVTKAIEESDPAKPASVPLKLPPARHGSEKRPQPVDRQPVLAN